MAQEQDNGDDMADGKGNRAPDHIEFQQAVAKRPECHDARKQQEFPAMMLAQRIAREQPDPSHFPGYRQIAGQFHLP